MKIKGYLNVNNIPNNRIQKNFILIENKIFSIDDITCIEFFEKSIFVTTLNKTYIIDFIDTKKIDYEFDRIREELVI